MHHNYLRLLQLRRGGMLAPDTGTGGGDGGQNGGHSGADDQGSKEGTGDGEGEGEGKSGGDKTFTQEEVNRIVARELAKNSRNHQRDIDNARSEGERLARMSADERAEHERQQREDDYNNRLKQLERRELSAEIRSQLSEKGLDPQFTQFIPTDSAETAKAAIDNLHKVFNSAVEKKVQEEVEKRLKQGAGAPPAGSGGKPMTMREAIAARYGENRK